MRTFCAVMMSTMLASAGCAPMGDDDSPPVRDGGHEPGTDAPTADGSVADGSVADGSVDRTPPTITETDPADGATGVEPMLAITARFDEPIIVGEPADGLQLLDDAGQPVPGTVEVDGAVLRFLPADDLTLLGSYTAVVTAAVTDLAGNPLAGEHRFQLTVRDGTWEPTGTLVENSDAIYPHSPDVAMDPRGNVAVVWSHESPHSSVWASYYHARTGLWEAAQQLEHDEAGDAQIPLVAMDGAGNAIAVWLQAHGARNHVWASRHDGTAWDEPVRLDTSDTATADWPHLAMNDDGAAIVVWQHTEGATRQAWINRFVAGSGWGVAEPVQLLGQPAAIASAGGTPAVGIDDQGDAIVLVVDHMYHPQAVPHRAVSGWGEAETLTQPPVTGISFAMAPTGYAFATWQALQPPRIQAWRHDPGGASQVDVLMEGSEQDGAFRPGNVAVSPAGDGITLWIQDNPRPRQIWAGVYSAADEAWAAPESVVSTVPARPRDLQVAMGPRGHAHAFWILSDGTNLRSVTTHRVAPGGFGATTVYDRINEASLAVNAQGKAVMIRAVLACVGGNIDIDAVFFR